MARNQEANQQSRSRAARCCKVSILSWQGVIVGHARRIPVVDLPSRLTICINEQHGRVERHDDVLSYDIKASRRWQGKLGGPDYLAGGDTISYKLAPPTIHVLRPSASPRLIENHGVHPDPCRKGSRYNFRPVPIIRTDVELNILAR